MATAIELVLAWRGWIFAGLLVMGGLYAWRLARALEAGARTPFGLEKEAARRRQDSALAMLAVVIGIGIGVQLVAGYLAPAGRGQAAEATPATPTPAPTPTPVVGAGPLVVDSSGCENPSATLTEPAPGARISGSFEVRGAANLPGFAFYKFEISGLATNGAWVPLHVGNVPVIEGSLGAFDAGAYAPGEYAFRLVVMDAAGNFPAPCVVPVTLVSLTGP